MKDDWKLKDKMKILDGAKEGCDCWDIIYYYKPSDIDTLRKKLIENLLEYEEWKELSKESIIEIVNKRFGVDE